MSAIGLPRLSSSSTKAASHSALASARRRDAASASGHRPSRTHQATSVSPQQRVRAASRGAAAARALRVSSAASARAARQARAWRPETRRPLARQRVRPASRARPPAAPRRGGARQRAVRTPRRGRRRPSSPSGSSGHPSCPYSGGLIARSARNAWPQGLCAAKAALEYAATSSRSRRYGHSTSRHEPAAAASAAASPCPRERRPGLAAQRHEQRQQEQRRRHDHHARVEARLHREEGARRERREPHAAPVPDVARREEEPERQPLDRERLQAVHEDGGRGDEHAQAARGERQARPHPELAEQQAGEDGDERQRRDEHGRVDARRALAQAPGGRGPRAAPPRGTAPCCGTGSGRGTGSGARSSGWGAAAGS